MCAVQHVLGPLPEVRQSWLYLIFLFCLGCDEQPQGGAVDVGGAAPDSGDAALVSSDGPVPPPADGPVTPDSAPVFTNPLLKVKYWAYQINGLEKPKAVDLLVASRYDLLVVDPTRTAHGSVFDSKGMVTRLHATKGKSGARRLVLAYVSVGEAEKTRYYWKSWWKAPTRSAKGAPDFLVARDPDGWSGVYPVAYWDSRWKKILFEDADSMLQKVLDDGYDGIYMDWIEAFYHKQVVKEAKQQNKDPAKEMIKLVGQLLTHARKRSPNFLLLAQNAPELAKGHPEYLKLIHGIAQEPLYFDGDADVSWSSARACDQRIDNSQRAFYEALLKPFLAAGLPVFDVEYACQAKNVKEAHDLAAKRGFLPYVTRRPLDRLTSTPPPGY